MKEKSTPASWGPFARSSFPRERHAAESYLVWWICRVN